MPRVVMLMIFFSETSFDFCGDEYIYAEISREMTISSTLKAISITNELKTRNIPGIIEIYPNNTSYLVRYNPNIISPHHLLEYLRDVDQLKNKRESLDIESRLIDIPILYDNDLSKQISQKYADFHEQGELSNFEYVMKMSGLQTKEELIKKHSMPVYFVTAMGFKPGTAWCYPLTDNIADVIQVPKYKSPRPFTPVRSIGLGGAFSVIYPSNSSGSYQLIGRSAVPVYDVHMRLDIFKNSNSFFLANPGDLWKYRPVSLAEYRNIREQVRNGTYKFHTKRISFSAAKYDELGQAYIKELLEGFL